MPLFAHHHEITFFFYKYWNGSPNQSSQQATLYDVDLLNLGYDGKGPGLESQPTAYVNLHQCGKTLNRSWAWTEPSASTPQGCPVFPATHIYFSFIFASMASCKASVCLSLAIVWRWSVRHFIISTFGHMMVTTAIVEPASQSTSDQHFRAKTKGTSMFLSRWCV